MQTDTGETTKAIQQRSDDNDWPFVKAELEAGATLHRIPKLKRAYPDKGAGAYGRGISDSRVRKLEREGVLRYVGVDRYALTTT